MSDQYYPVPQPEEIEIREREDAMGSYFMMFASMGAGLPLPFLNLIASAIYFYVNRNKGRFVKFHLVQSMYSQIPVTLMNSVAVVWGLRLFFTGGEISQAFAGFLVTLLVVNLAYFILSVIAAVQARQGRFYYFPFFGKMAYHMSFLKTWNDDDEYVGPINHPPV